VRRFIEKENLGTRGADLWRSLSSWEETGPAHVLSQGRRYCNFSSNDYLGLSRHPKVIASAREALERYGAGGRSSRLIAGSLDLHRELEDKIARFKHAEAALVFPAGFMANLGVIASLCGPGDAVIVDRLDHASLIDAAKLSRARPFVYDHASPESLERVLKRARSYDKRLVVTDALFSMDGDAAPLPELLAVCEREGAWLMIDDAHATGIFGRGGIGMAEHFGLLGRIPIVMGTLSKALGSQGGFVCGSKEFIDFLVNRARSFIYTTAIAPAAAGAALASLDLIKQEPERREKLLALSKSLRSKLKARFPGQAGEGLNSPIIPFSVGSADKTLALAAKLRDRGIYAPAIRPPTVPKNESRLRFSVTSEHAESDLDRLVEALSS
jgi:8-amino-7-oxononanoate synthase